MNLKLRAIVVEQPSMRLHAVVDVEGVQEDPVAVTYNWHQKHKNLDPLEDWFEAVEREARYQLSERDRRRKGRYLPRY